ncbi:hypothetical protein DUI87_11242 [Hirundo rustica rustica]|uniref:Uncharacterized protein n=1 Tax=Hirundo rustica rustica TaxID=333673 RepID=A0A3M0KYB6_HIRRU|nr:hypothetical protein DUI87_11242 [Hirundo rustica rustica]
MLAASSSLRQQDPEARGGNFYSLPQGRGKLLHSPDVEGLEIGQAGPIQWVSVDPSSALGPTTAPHLCPGANTPTAANLQGSKWKMKKDDLFSSTNRTVFSRRTVTELIPYTYHYYMDSEKSLLHHASCKINNTYGYLENIHQNNYIFMHYMKNLDRIGPIKL